MEELDTYEDEPMTSVRPQEFSGSQMVIENMDEVDRKTRKRRKKRRQRIERLGKIAVCICVIGVIVAIVLTIVLTEAAIAVTTQAPPTLSPTPMPAVPTYKPTRAHPTPTSPSLTPVAPIAPVAPPTKAPVAVAEGPVQDEYTLNPDQDTYIYTNGNDQSRSYGKEETVLVQNGLKNVDTVADSFIIMTFNTASIPTFDKLAADGKQATLKMFRQPLDITEQNREPAPITVSRMHSTELTIESLNGVTFEAKDFWDGPTEQVPTDAVEVTFNVTDLVFNDALEDNQLFLMLQARNQEQLVGDRFFSRESDTPPQLIFTGTKP